MGLSRDERRYLEAFEGEAHRRGANGWLECNKAAERSSVDNEGGKLASRLSAQGYLEQRKKGFPDFRITPAGANALLPWWRRDRVTIAIAIIGWTLAIVLALVQWVLK